MIDNGVTEFDLRPRISKTITITEPDFGFEIQLGVEVWPEGYVAINWTDAEPSFLRFIERLQKDQGFEAYPTNAFLTKYWAKEITEALKEPKKEEN